MTTPVDQASFAQLVERFNTLLDSWEGTGGGGLTAAGALALDAAVAADGGASNQMIGLTAGGTLKRFTTNLFASRRTQDLDVLPGSDYAEWLSCLGSTGLEYKIAAAALSRSFGDVIDPTRPPYNVVFDAQKVVNVNFHLGTNVIDFPNNSNFAGWNQSDIGKLAFVSNHVGCYYYQDAYIGYVSPDGKQCQLFLDKAFTQPANGPRDGNGYEQMIWGTDCTAGMQAALDAAEPRSYETHGQTVALGGFTMVRRLRFGSVSIVGLSAMGSGFYHIQAGDLSSGGGYDAWIAPKSSGGLYDDNHRPHHYSLMNMSLFGQQYTSPYNYANFRRVLQIYGGGFNQVYSGASYARIEGIDIYDSPWDGFLGDGVYAGLLKDIRAFGNRDCGLRVGFYDLNGENWHAEGNGLTGVYSTMQGANVFGVRCSFNGAGAAGNANPDEHGANYTEVGKGNTVTNARFQESWSHNLCFSDVDTNNIRNNSDNGSGNAVYLGTFDDTADVSSMVRSDGSLERSADGLPNIRSMIHFRKTMGQYNFQSVSNNTVSLVTGSYQVRTVNYATNGVSMDSYGRNNQVTLRTPNISNNPGDWCSQIPGVSSPGDAHPAFSAGPYAIKNSGSDTFASLSNAVTVNGQTAP